MIYNFQGNRVDWPSYFSLYNIEYEILLNALEHMYFNEKICRLNDIIKPKTFKRLNPRLVNKLVDRGLLKKIKKKNNEYYVVTTRGLVAFFSILQIIDDVINKEGAKMDEIPSLVKDNLFLGGIYKVFDVHKKLLERTIVFSHKIGFYEIENGFIKLSNDNKRIESLIRFLRRISSLTTIRNIEELVHTACRALLIPAENEKSIVNTIVSKSTVVHEREPSRVITDLIYKVMNLSQEKLRSGKLIEAAAYEALGVELLNILEKTGLCKEEICIEKSKLLFYLYTILGDYMYNSLVFDLARIMYHLAIQVARDDPSLTKEAKRVNAKYLLSTARYLARQGRYEEAIFRLQELVGYYRSTGSLRESLIAEALMNEYLAELELKKKKPCNAYKSFLRSTSIYEEVGGEYKSKAEALRIKTLICLAECNMISEKNIDKAIENLRKASMEAENILSPHLKNVAESLLHELLAAKNVIEGRYLEGSKEYMISSKYYSYRGRNYRALLNLARAYKFEAYHYINSNDLINAYNSLEKAKDNYYKLLKRIINKYYLKKKIDYYLLKESIKGYLDVEAMIKLIYEIIEEKKISEETIYQVKELLIEGGRMNEYRILELYQRSLMINTDFHKLVSEEINIEELSPRTKVFLKILTYSQNQIPA
ncbi:MAG: hypothetical protein J7J82_05130, partial [Staphylothermus sp.]|nr:hypothetical protein [Staphylothermus sp.]